MRFKLIQFTALLAVLPVPAPVQAATDEGPALMVVFDGSGSMWGEIRGEREAKFTIAQTYLSRLLPTLPDSTRLGLTVFANGCSGTNILQAPTTAGTKRFLKSLAAVSPRGKGAITKALGEAVSTLEPGKPGAVILIHDGPDSCPADPCKAAQRIAASHPGLPVHMVSVGLKTATANAMSCIAELTGGIQHRARNAAEFAKALKAALNSAAVPAPTPASKQAALAKSEAPIEPPEPSGPPRLRVSAALSEGGAAIDAPVRWHISGIDETNKLVLSGSSPAISRPVPPGRYEVKAQLGLVAGKTIATVADVGTTSVTIPLNAAVARVSVRAKFGSNDITDATLTITPSAPANSNPVLITRDTSKPFYLPAGEYRFAVEKGHAHARDTIVLRKGDDRAIDAILGSGTLDLAAFSAEGGSSIEDVTYEIAVDDPDAENGRRILIRSGAPTPSFILPAGTYYITARAGLAQTRRLFAVGAGDTVDGSIAMNLAKIVLRAQLDNSEVPASTPMYFQVLRGERGKVIGSSTQREPRFTLPAGKYKIRATIGTQNASVLSPLTLAPGDEREITLDIPAARVTLRSAAAATTATTLWRIRTADRRILWSANLPEPTTLLSPGTYVIERDIRGRRTAKTVSVSAGVPKTVEFAAP